jgi:hypothetical protein
LHYADGEPTVDGDDVNYSLIRNQRDGVATMNAAEIILTLMVVNGWAY